MRYFRPPHLLFISLILVWGFLHFYPSLNLGYLSDDYDILAAVTSPAFSVWDAFPAGTGSYFRPLITLALSLEEHIPLFSPAVRHHAASLGIHLLNCILVYAIGNAIASSIGAAAGPVTGNAIVHRQGFACLLALFFCTHPANAYDVFMIHGRVDSQAAFFYLLTVFLFIRYLQTGRLRHLWAAALAVPATLLSKEFGVTLWAACAILLLIWRGWIDRQLPPRRVLTAWRFCLVALLVTIAFAAAVYIAFYHPAPSGALSLASNPLDALEALATFPVLFIYPNRQMLLIHLYKVNPWLLPAGILLAALLLGAGAALVLRRRAFRTLALGLLVGGLVFLPASLMLLTGGVHSRQIYTPLAMLCIGVAILAHVFPRRLPWLAAVLFFGLLLALPATRHQSQAYLQQAQLRDQLCQDFRAAVPESTADQTIFLLSPPAAAFFNDAAATLYHCQFNQFGVYPRLYAMGTLQSESFPLPAVRLTQPAPDTVHITVNDALDFFLFPSGLSPDTTVPTAFGDLRLTSLRADGYTNGYQFRFLPQVLRSSYVLWFDGEHIRVFSAPH